MLCYSCHSTLLVEARFCHICGSRCAGNQTEPQHTASALPDRRQLTVMFCDLVGYTALSEELDPEDLRDIIRRFQECCSSVIKQFDGYISRFMGDGILVFFGYPEAHEDDAARSIHAALKMVQEIAALKASRSVSARIGIATGIVVAGDLIGEGSAEEMAVVGSTPNIAARLQAKAKPNEVVVSADTQRLVDGLFQFEKLGPQQLKGLNEPVFAYRALVRTDAKNRFEAKVAHGLSPMVGRERELEMLLKCWRETQHSTSHFVLINSEPGLGKSRLLNEFKYRAQCDQAAQLNLFCSPFHKVSPLHPLIELVEKMAGIEQKDTAKNRLAKLESLLSVTQTKNRKMGDALRLLLSSNLTVLAETMQPHRVEDQQRLLQGLVDFVAAIADKQPVMMVIEDVHWIDPSTLEWLILLKSSLAHAPLLAVITYRTGFSPPPQLTTHSYAVELNRLSRTEARTLIQYQTSRKALPAEVMDRILFKTDGVPLFIEEFTKTVLNSDQLHEVGDRYEISGRLSPLAVPASLQDSLASRLNQIGPAKEVSKLAAAIGQDFDFELLASLSGVETPQLHLILEQLMADGVLVAIQSGHATHYRFKHALLRDAAYQSLLKTQKRAHHEKIAYVLERRANLQERPEIIAHHYFESGQIQKSIPYWLKAGQFAVRHFANLEAITHFKKALASIETIGCKEERTDIAIEIYLHLGAAFVATKGSASKEAEGAYRNCRDLSRQGGSFKHQFMATWGLWASAQQSGRIETAIQLTAELDQLARQSSDPLFALQAHHASWTSAYRTANFQACCDHAESGTNIYRADLHANSSALFGNHDAGICALYHAGMSRWILGFPDIANSYKGQMSSLVAKLEDPVNRAITMMYELFLCCLLRDWGSALNRAEMIAEVCGSYDVAPQCRIAGKIMCGWVHTHNGNREQGLGMMRDGLMEKRDAPSRAHEAYLLALFADACIKSGLPEDANESVSEAFRLVINTGECTWEAELHRLAGEVLVAGNLAEDLPRAEEAFLKAQAIAEQQKALSLQLRAAQSLAKLWCTQGRKQEAEKLLSGLCGKFTEGYQSFDLMQAEQLRQSIS